MNSETNPLGLVFLFCDVIEINKITRIKIDFLSDEIGKL